MNKSIKTVLLLTIVLLFTIGVVSAADIQSNDDTTTSQESTTSTTTAKDIQTISSKVITKNTIKNVKTGDVNTTTKSKVEKNYTANVTNYKQFVNKFNTAKKSNYATYTINLKKGNYDATGNLTFANTTKTDKLIINGNGSVINGKNKYHFMTIDYGYTVILNNITLKNFAADEGGAIYNEGTLTVKNSVFADNEADNGGAIYSSGDLEVTNCVFRKNYAEADGGAIYLDKTENCIITRNSFTGNMAGEDGGAIYIYNSYGTSIKNNNFTKNIAKDDGGAIANIPRSESYTYSAQESYLFPETYMEQYWNPVKNYGIIGYTTTYNYNPMGYSTPIQIPQYGYTGGYDYRTATRYVTKYRTVTRTGYHYYGSDTTIHGNNFIENKATTKGSAIYVSHGEVKIYKNKFQRNNVNLTLGSSITGSGDLINKSNSLKYSKYDSTIYNAGDSNVTGNSFDDRKVTVLNVYNIAAAKYGSTIKISGKLMSNGKAVQKANITINVGGTKYTTKTLSSGYFTIKYKVKSYKQQKVVFTYAGNKTYQSSKNYTILSAKQHTKINPFKIVKAKVGKTIRISGKLLSSETKKGAKQQTVKVNVGGQTYTAKTLTSGYFTVQHKVTSAGRFNVKFSFAGNKEYYASKATTQFQSVK